MAGISRVYGSPPLKPYEAQSALDVVYIFAVIGYQGGGDRRPNIKMTAYVTQEHSPREEERHVSIFPQSPSPPSSVSGTYL